MPKYFMRITNPTSVPVFMVEANYEFEDNTGMDYGSPATLRRQEYWTMLSGATGQLLRQPLYLDVREWLAKHAGYSRRGNNLQYMKALFAPRPWYNLSPDQSHTVVTAGYGTFSSTGSLGANNYVTAASTPDGALVMAYMPTISTITVDMSKLSGPAAAQWYDPTNAAYATVPGSPCVNAGTRQFTPPGNNSAGNGDWVLVLQANAQFRWHSAAHRAHRIDSHRFLLFSDQSVLDRFCRQRRCRRLHGL